MQDLAAGESIFDLSFGFTPQRIIDPGETISLAGIRPVSLEEETLFDIGGTISAAETQEESIERLTGLSKAPLPFDVATAGGEEKLEI